MEQLAICHVQRTGPSRSAGMVVVLQHALLSDLNTRVVAPLVLSTELPHIPRLRPKVQIEEKEYVVAIDRLAAVPRRSIGKMVGSMQLRREEMIAAIDFLFTGV
jgi:toxin CcdB